MGDTILDAAVKYGIDENWWLLNNQSTYNASINGKYMSNIRYAHDGQYIHVHCNSGVKYGKKIINIPGYSNHIWYKLKGIAKILSLILVKKYHIVT